MKIRYIVYLITVFFLGSCKSNKRVRTTKSNTYLTKTTIPLRTDKIKSTTSIKAYNVDVPSGVVDKIISKALSYKGTKYKYGGTSKSGIDCSGLMYVSFKSVDILLPRTSFSQSKKGFKVSKSAAQKGDLVFFNTGGKANVNHVGLVVSADDREVKFVHSSSSRGVMISSLREGYWSSVFSHIRRLHFGKPNKAINNDKKQSTTYVVRSGDTLYAIAKRYSGVTVSKIVSYNNLSSTALSPGMILKIPIL